MINRMPVNKLSAKALKGVIEEFITYALTKPEVRIVPFIDIVRWCGKPVGLDGTTGLRIPEPETGKDIGIALFNNNLKLTGAFPGMYQISVYSIAGKKLFSKTVSVKNPGVQTYTLHDKILRTDQVYVVTVWNGNILHRIKVINNKN